jgi:hypothetical protein
MVCKTGFRTFRLVLSVITSGLLALHPVNAQSTAGETVVQRDAIVQSSIEQPISEPTVHDIESSVLDADFSPGEATTNTPAELDEINASHDGHLDFTGVTRPLDYLVDRLGALDEAAGLRLGVAYTMLYLQPTGGLVIATVPLESDFLSRGRPLGEAKIRAGRFRRYPGKETNCPQPLARNWNTDPPPTRSTIAVGHPDAY